MMRPRLQREAYYEAMKDLGIARDTLQIHIGMYLAAVNQVRRDLLGQAPEMRDRFDAVAKWTTRRLQNDLEVVPWRVRD